MILTNEEFRREIITYLNQHWEEEPSAKCAAQLFGYSEKYFNRKFKECFGVTFMKYLQKVMLHRVALEICETRSLTNVGKKAGFSSPQSFSKAFRKEFGYSPRQLLQSEEEVPDISDQYQIYGNEVQVEYVTSGKMCVHGYPVIPVHGNQSNLVEERGYLFRHRCENVNTSVKDQEQIAMWWHGEQCELRYIMGPLAELNQEAPAGSIKVLMPSEYYAVISVAISPKVADEPEVITEIMKELSKYAYYEWAIINRKRIKQMAYTFEKYSYDRISLWIPIQRRNQKMDSDLENLGPVAWTEYIDAHIGEKITVEQLAEHFSYSPSHFNNTFSLYYNITPGLYMKKRRLYLAASTLRRGEHGVNEVIATYGYPSEKAFYKEFEEEFHCRPEEYMGEEYRTENLQQYYENNKHVLICNSAQVDDFSMTGESVLPSVNSNNQQDALGYIIHHLNRQDSDMPLEGKVVVWQTVPESNEKICLVGTPVGSHHTKTTKNQRTVRIKGGSYVVLETQNETDRKNLMKTYRMMYRCAFEGWIREHRARVDLSRLTFVRYISEKLYFFIPVYE